jgi:hypothetical protein
MQRHRARSRGCPRSPATAPGRAVHQPDRSFCTGTYGLRVAQARLQVWLDPSMGHASEGAFLTRANVEQRVMGSAGAHATHRLLLGLGKDPRPRGTSFGLVDPGVFRGRNMGDQMLRGARQTAGEAREISTNRWKLGVYLVVTCWMSSSQYHGRRVVFGNTYRLNAVRRLNSALIGRLAHPVATVTI